MVGALPVCCFEDEDAAKKGTDDSGADDFKSPTSKDDHIGVDRFELGAMATNAAAAGRRKLPPMLTPSSLTLSLKNLYIHTVSSIPIVISRPLESFYPLPNWGEHNRRKLAESVQCESI